MEVAKEARHAENIEHGHSRPAQSPAPASHPMLQLQQQAGNAAVQQLLLQGFIKPKLTISSPGDPEEREADQVADHVMRAHTGFPISAQSSSDEEEEEGGASPHPSVAIQRSAAALGPSKGGNAIASSLSSTLSNGGRPLDPTTRAFFEPRMGHDFSGVRVHTGPQAASSARSIQALAFTAGQHIVFGEGQFAPHTSSGGHLLAHELTHVAQQDKAPPHQRNLTSNTKSPSLAASTSMKVQRSEDANAAPAPSGGANEKEPEDTTKKDLGFWSEATISLLSSPARVVGETAYGLVRSTWHGFFAEFQGRDDSLVDKIKDRIKEFATSPKELLAFFPRYWWGLIKGIFSPITGLFDMAKLAIQLEGIAETVITTAWKNRDKLATDAKGIGAKMREMGAHAWSAVKGFAAHPIDTAMQLGPLLEAAKAKANGAAEQGGHGIAKALYKNADQPIPEQGEAAGEIIGTVVVNIALIVFTEGIGDAILQIAGKLGEVGAWLSRFGKGAKLIGGVLQGLVKIMEVAGGFIATVEHLIGAVAGTILKPLEPVFREFGEMMSGLKTFFKDLFESAESLESEGASTAAKTLSKGAGETPRIPKSAGDPLEHPAPAPRSPEPPSPKPGQAPEPNSPSPPKELPKPANAVPKEAEEIDDKFVAAIELDRNEAEKQLEQWIKLDPKREVGIWMDPATNKCVLVQGEEGLVDNRWLLKEPDMDHRWVLLEHYHPGEDTAARLASTGDFRTMMHDMIFGTIEDAPISTNIRWIDPATGDHLITEIGFVPKAPEPYYIKFKDIDGTDIVKTFKDEPWVPGSDYEDFLRSRGSGPTTHSGPAAPAGSSLTATPPPAAPKRLVDRLPEPHPIPAKGLANYETDELWDFYSSHRADYPSAIRKEIQELENVRNNLSDSALRKRLENLDSSIRKLHTDAANKMVGKGNAGPLDRPFISSQRATSNEGSQISSLITDEKQLSLTGQLKSGGTVEFDSVQFKSGVLKETKLSIFQGGRGTSKLGALEKVKDQMLRQAMFAQDWGFIRIEWSVLDHESMLFAQEARQELLEENEELARFITVGDPTQAWR